MNCSMCGNEIPDGAKFCGICGSAVKREAFCSNCGYKFTSEQRFCPQCGSQTERMGLAVSKNEKQTGISGKFQSNVVVKALKEVPRNVINEQEAADIAKIISMHALGAAASGAATAWIPGAGASVAAVGQAAFVWTMYTRISQRLGINLSKKKLKFLGSAVLSNLVCTVGTLFAASAFSLIPGIGSVTAALIVASAGYAMVTAAGIVYVKLMSSLLNEGTDMSYMSDEELRERMREVMEGQNVRTMMKEAQSEYVRARKAGTVSGRETVDLEEE